MASQTVRTLIGAAYLDGNWQAVYDIAVKLFFTEPKQELLAEFTQAKIS